MPKRSSSRKIGERVLDLAWSLWTELGVSGWRRRHQGWGIDPEPLIIFTAWMADLDPRLRDESLDWCITFGHYISRARLRNLLRSTDEATLSAFGTYAATVNAHSKLNWPHATKPRRYHPTGRSELRGFTEASLLALRLRALFGVSARAEVIRVLLGTSTPATTSEIAAQIDYTKRNVAEALEALALAGLVSSEYRGNTAQYRLNRQAVRSVAGSLPTLFPLWKSIFRVLSSIMNVPSRANAPRTALAVEARTAVESIQLDIAMAGLRGPDLSTAGEVFWDAFVAWTTEVTTGLALANPASAFEADRLPRYEDGPAETVLTLQQRPG
jgi:DNA-binding transcriptional ArsR family regulator